MTQYINNQNVERLKEFSYERYDWLMGVAVGQAQDEVSSVMWGTVGGTGAPQSSSRYECWRFCNYTACYNLQHFVGSFVCLQFTSLGDEISIIKLLTFRLSALSTPEVS